MIPSASRSTRSIFLTLRILVIGNQRKHRPALLSAYPLQSIRICRVPCACGITLLFPMSVSAHVLTIVLDFVRSHIVECVGSGFGHGVPRSIYQSRYGSPQKSDRFPGSRHRSRRSRDPLSYLSIAQMWVFGYLGVANCHWAVFSPGDKMYQNTLYSIHSISPFSLCFVVIIS